MTTDKPKIYIAGPMSGYEQFNFPAFFKAEERFIKFGFEVFNPAGADVDAYGEDIFYESEDGDTIDLEKNSNFSLRDALAKDLSWICREATDIYMLAGWENSKGAKAEHALAVALDLEMWYE